MRPIDADALLKHRRNHGKPYAIDPIDKNIDDQLIELKHVLNAPTLDYAPVAHGEWSEVEGYDGDCHYQCSLCGEEWTLNDGTPLENNMNYCPRCGARMDGKEETTSSEI